MEVEHEAEVGVRSETDPYIDENVRVVEGHASFDGADILGEASYEEDNHPCKAVQLDKWADDAWDQPSEAEEVFFSSFPFRQKHP